MAQITEFEVTGLVGRRTPFRQQLNRDVNVFFGVNGSGKTSLLKILHGAMSSERRSLLNVAFSSASVAIFSSDNKREFIGTFDKSKQSHLPFESEILDVALCVRA
ncbi:MAG TPA: hypothetical protein VN181_04620 [Thermoanaerobaculia bacterium]|nr:hypothetical protein [Thermoanaerobaculia bacterium]